MRRLIAVFLMILTLISLPACAAQKRDTGIKEVIAEPSMELTQIESTSSAEKRNNEKSAENTLMLSVDGKTVQVIWEDNEAVQELKNLAQEVPILVTATRYGGFEQVGSLPQNFTRNDVQITTEPGDIVLYSGNQLVVFFGSNSWSFTKLGHLNGLSEEELEELLNQDSVEITIQYE